MTLGTNIVIAYPNVQATDQAKECLKIKEVIWQTQSVYKGLVSSVTSWWSKVEGKEKRDMVIDKIRLNKDSRRVQKTVQRPKQGQWTISHVEWHLAHGANLDELSHQISVRSPALQHKPGTMGKERRSHLSTMQRQTDHVACLELLPSRSPTRVLHMEAYPTSSGTCPGHKYGYRTEHPLRSSCQVDLQQGPYTWRNLPWS